MKVLIVDVGGTHVNILASGQKEPRRFSSGPNLTAKEMVRQVQELTGDWKFDAVSIGYSGPVMRGRPIAEPHNLGGGWVGFSFEAFRRHVEVVNDAAMQAMGSYTRGKMLFLGLGTGLGSTLIVDGFIELMEMSHLPYRKGTYEDYIGARALAKLGQKKWQHYISDMEARLTDALEPDDVVLRGGNAKKLKKLPPGCRAGDNANAFLGGFRLWEKEHIDGSDHRVTRH